MAQLFRGTTISPTTTVTAQTLHNLIEGAIIGGVTPGDIAGSPPPAFLSAGLVAPNPTTFPFWYDVNTDDPVFRVYSPTYQLWLAAGPHRIEIALRNGTGAVVPRGSLVVQHPTLAPDWFSIATAPSLNAIGFVQATAVSGAWAPVAIAGIGYGLFASAYSAAWMAWGPGNFIISRREVPPGSFHHVLANIASSAISGPILGIELEQSRSGTSLSGSLHRIQIWPPRIKIGGW